MESRLVLVIEGDEQTANRLAAAIREADYEVVVSPTAGAGLDIAIEIKPDCIVCDVELPDEDGYWVARNIRTHHSQVSVTPFLFLSGSDDPQARIEGFHVGADVYMTKPFRLQEVVAQVDALVQMAARLRERRDEVVSVTAGPDYGTTAIEGDLRQMSIATVLSVLGMERRTGVFEVVSKKRRAQVEISGGYVVHGTIGGTRVNALAAVRVMLGWNVGRFSFTPLPPYDLPPSLRSVQALLLDAAKAEDEAAAAVPPSLRFDGHFVASSFGGPASRPDDTAPPSSRAMREASAGPVSLTFDLVPTRRGEDMPAVEVFAAVDAPIAILERARAEASPVPRSEPKRKPPPARGDPSKGGPLPSVAIDLDEAFRPQEEEVISVAWEELETESIGGERMLHREITPTAVPSVRRGPPRRFSTLTSGTPVTEMRPPPAPPPNTVSGVHSKPLPPPTAVPRVLAIPPAPRSPGEKARAQQRATPKKT
jgi:two-component system OmpR family response regulator